MYKRSSLFGLPVSGEGKKFYNIGPCLKYLVKPYSPRMVILISLSLIQMDYFKSSTVVEHSPHNPNVAGSGFASALASKLPKYAVTFSSKYLLEQQTHKLKLDNLA